MKRIALLCLFLTGQAQANEWGFAVVLNGISHHNGACGLSPCNEKNNGLGFELKTTSEEWPTRIVAGAFKNSVYFNSWYAGLGKTYRWGDRFAVELGGFGGYFHYPVQTPIQSDYFVVLPLMVFDLNYVRINVIYLPTFTKEVTAAWFFQMVAPIRSR